MSSKWPLTNTLILKLSQLVVLNVLRVKMYELLLFAVTDLRIPLKNGLSLLKNSWTGLIVYTIK